MRGPGEVLLVSCYELGHQPLAVASALGFLHAAGFAADAVDTAVEPLTDAKLGAARLVAISVPMHTALRLGLRVAERVRAVNPRACICFFGLYATLNRELLLGGAADAVVGGEHEGALVRLAAALETGTPDGVAGVCTTQHPSGPSLERLAFVAPRRDRLPPLDRYARFVDGAGERLAGYVEASRGCLHRCRHCPIVPVYGGRFFAIPADVVLADARVQIEAGATHITFGDPDFLNGPGHVMAIARRLHDAHPAVTFDVTIKIEHILEHAGLMTELRDLGCAFVVSAIESLTDGVLERLAKGHTRADVDRALAILDRANLPLRPTFIPFTPWSGLDDYLELLDWLAANDLVESVEPIQLAIRLLVPPGSALLDLPATAGWPGPLDADGLTHRWRHADPRMDELHARAAARVAAAVRVGEPAAETFRALRRLALAAANLDDDPLPPPLNLGPRRDQPPRLSEAWFC